MSIVIFKYQLNSVLNDNTPIYNDLYGLGVFKGTQRYNIILIILGVIIYTNTLLKLHRI